MSAERTTNDRPSAAALVGRLRAVLERDAALTPHEREALLDDVVAAARAGELLDALERHARASYWARIFAMDGTVHVQLERALDRPDLARATLRDVLTQLERTPVLLDFAEVSA